MFKRLVEYRLALFFLLCLVCQSGCAAVLPFIDVQSTDPEAARIAAAKERIYRSSERPRRVRREVGGKSVLSKYIRELSSKEDTKRTAAASYLGLMGENAGPAVPALIGALNDQSHWVRRAAARALGRIGTPALQAKSALRSATQDRDPYVARTAKLALEKLALEKLGR